VHHQLLAMRITNLIYRYGLSKIITVAVTVNGVKMIFKSTFLWVVFMLFAGYSRAVPFSLVTLQSKVSIVYDAGGHKLDSIAAHLLAQDIQRVSGYLPKVFTDINKVSGNVIIIGSNHSKLISSLHQRQFGELDGLWECYNLSVLPHPFKNITSALIIAGSDTRGTAYGVFDISARIGVTPWYWWADATPDKKKSIVLDIKPLTSAPPSVKYRGIFINDEDWGLQPWAAKTFEPETGDIGPKTYAKVFELLLRLKANLIWPAMHPSTKPFFHYPGNVKVAEDYEIVIGSSHAEPMLRNNVGEWDEKTMGAFNYITNKQKVSDYWESRVKESSRANAIYSMGMRGVHDSGIEGVKTIKETVPLLERIFADQRNMLKQYVNPDIKKVPQAFTAYKEVLDVYDAGLKLPDDVTLVWPDDNYGYIQRLDNEQESKRAGGAGIYYHASYWGRPHDYIWLSTTNPGLMREEMTKAYAMQARNLWVLNVGDIKPAEYNIQLFMDMAYQIQSFNNSAYPKIHLQHWVADNVDRPHAPEIANTLWQYYQLAFERKPEFMGWSQTEPTTQVKFTAYNHFNYGDQAQQRIDAYNSLEQTVKKLRPIINAAKQDCFYQLVYYPVIGASLMNKKFLYRDKAYLYAQQGRISARSYDSLSKASYQQIVNETQYYNTKLASGKWANIMSMSPRNLPVYQLAESTYKIEKRTQSWSVLPEGATEGGNLALPVFGQAFNQSDFMDVFLTKDTIVNYTVHASAPWIKVSQQTGRLTSGSNQSRLWVSVDRSKLALTKSTDGFITIKSGDRSFKVIVKADKEKVPQGYKGFIENNGYISIQAKNYQGNLMRNDNHWDEIDGFGSTGTSMQAVHLSINATFKPDATDKEIKNGPVISYNFITNKTAPAEVKIYTIPTYPLNKNFEMRYAVSVDDGPATVLNFKTVGRSEEWKQNVLSNSAMRSVKMQMLSAGKHVLHIYLVDPGVILDRILIDLGGLKPFYGLVPETLYRPSER
jgi:hypothetical protein